jgi:CBS domain containing-hemolysin-like protein
MIIWNILLIFILVALNGFFVAIEFAVVAARKSRLELLLKEGHRSAEIVKSWVENPVSRDRLIAAAQLGITVVSLALGSVGENTFEAILEPYFEHLDLPPALGFFSTILPVLPLVISLIITTSLHVVLGEQVPKVAVLKQPERSAILMAQPMKLFTRVFKSFVDILDWATRMVLSLFGLEAVGEHSSLYTVDEIKQILSDSERVGLITEPGKEMLHAVLDFGGLVVRQVMLPRTEVVAIPADATFDEIVDRMIEHKVTKFPVYEDNLDQTIGILHVKRVLGVMGKPESHRYTARDLTREAIYVPEALPVNTLLHRFRDNRQHIAIVLDEYGGTAGLVTLEDLMEEIVGEVSDPFDPEIPEFKTLPDGSVQVNGLNLIDDVNIVLGVDLEDPHYDTIAGYVLGLLGRIPAPNDEFEANGIRFKVEEMDGLRIERLTLTRLDNPESE